MRHFRRFAGAVAVALAAFHIVAAAEVLQQVPRDALGLVVVRKLADADVKAGRMLSAFGSRLPGPLAFLKSLSGVGAGLDERRDLMLVLLPPQSNSTRFSLALWLPVTDYDVLVHSLDGDPGRRVAAVTLAGEDLLVVRQDDWAVVMDPDERDRLEVLRDTQPAPPPQVESWADWVDEQDAAVVVLPEGMKVLWGWAESEQLFMPLPPAQARPASGDDLFGPVNLRAGAASGWPATRDWIRSMIAERPELARWAAEAESAACGLRLDREGNVVLGVKLAVSEAAAPIESSKAGSVVTPATAPSLDTDGDFVVTGSGRVSPQWVVPAVAPYVRQVINDLATNYATPIDEADVAKFRQSVERSIAEIRAFAVLTRPGAGADAVFTNNFLALRVTNAKNFLALAGESVERWNEMLGKPQSAMRLIFKPKAITTAGHEGTEYSIDMAAAVDAPAIPEARASMEKLFGPGGLFRLQMVSTDPETVLLASATEEQIAQVIKGMSPTIKSTKEQRELSDASTLLTSEHAWQLFASPHGYTTWLKRQMDAVLGAVIGGPVVPQFPASPPLGFAGGVDGRVLWLETAIPIETVRGAATFWRK